MWKAFLLLAMILVCAGQSCPTIEDPLDDGTDNSIIDDGSSSNDDGTTDDGTSDDGSSDSNDDQNSEPTYTSATLPHQGFDFSAGAVPDFDDWESSDVDIVAWAPYPTYSELSYTTYLWMRCNTNTDQINYTKDMGEVSLSSVTEVPTTWDSGADQDLPPLQVNHVYVVKCHDGYAKVLVKALNNADYNLSDWEAVVEYAFTTGTTFAE